MPEKDQQQLDQLKQKYSSVLRTIEQSGVRLQHVHVRDNKLFIQGEAPSQDVKNRVWDEIKRIDPSYSDLTADISVMAGGASSASAQQQAGSAAAGGMQTYTVKSGDTLSKISQQFYGNPGQYMKIFEANREQLNDPDMIKPGQVLKIPK